MDNKLFIPKILKRGYNERSDTYTGKLAFVIYQDDKGVWRQEKSWRGWCQFPRDSKHRRWNYAKWQYENEGETYGEDLTPIVFENEPTEGFVLNKQVGGARYSYGHNTRVEKCRVFDPRGFEFEICVPNLLFIFQECNAYKGKGLEGQFVYAWDRQNLVLLPVGCEEYKQSKEYSKGVAKKFSLKDLKPYHIYVDKEGETHNYIGRDFFINPNYSVSHTAVTREHICCTDKGKLYKLPNNILEEVEPILGEKAANLAEHMSSSLHGNPVEEAKLGGEVWCEGSNSYYSRNKANSGIAGCKLSDGRLFLVRVKSNYYSSDFIPLGVAEVKNGLLKITKVKDLDEYILNFMRLGKESKDQLCVKGPGGDYLPLSYIYLKVAGVDLPGVNSGYDRVSRFNTEYKIR